MAEVARIGLSLGGAALFGPIGGVAGGVLGNLLFPPESQSIEGPRAETTVTTSAHGQPMTMVLGTKRVAGQLWDADDIREVKKEEGGGKGGGGPSVTTYEYFGTFMMFIAEVPEKGLTYKVRRVWRNKKLVYDRSVEPGEEETPEDQVDSFADIGSAVDYVSQAKSDVFENYVAFYDGATDQEPDPTLEALHGVGNVPAYRGMAYMVAKDMPLADTGNQIGSYEFEVVLEGIGDDLPQELIRGKQLYPWVNDPVDPRNGRNDHKYEANNTAYETLEEAFDAAAADLAADYGANGGPAPSLSDVVPVGWSYPGDADIVDHGPPGERVWLNLHFNTFVPDVIVSDGPRAGSLAFFPDDVESYDYSGVPIYDPRPGDDDSFTENSSIHLGLLKPLGSPRPTAEGRAILPYSKDIGGTKLDNSGSETGQVFAFVQRDIIVQVARVPSYPPSTGCSPPYRTIPEAPEWCINVETGDVRPKLTYTIEENDFVAAKAYREQNVDIDGDDYDIVADYPRGPVLRETDPNNTTAFWDSVDGDPDELTEAQVADFDLEAVIANPITLAEALRLIHQRAGITSSQIDTSAFGDKALWGMSIHGGTARSYIEALRTWGWFDWIESDGKLKGVPRGSDPVMTVDADDLGASTGEPVPRLQQERTEDLELPERVRIRYPSLNAAYQPGQQTSERLVTESRQVVDVDMSVADTDAHAAQAANIVANEQWRARMGRELSLPRQYDRLEPADVFSLTLDGVIYRLRVEEKTYQGAVNLRVVDDDAAEYTSEALAGTVLGGGTLGPLAGPTDIQVLDLPALDDAHDSAGYYIAAWGYTDGWGGCVVQRSTDGGETFANLVTITDEATVGEVVNPPAAALSTIIDEGGFIDVEMIAGDLADTNELAFLNGTANVAAIGAAGRWNIVSFRDVEELDVPGDRVRYRLTYLLQGRLGTEHAIGRGRVGDRFVLLNTALSRASGATNAVGVSQVLRGVTFGTDAANADNESVTPQGVALKPWAPAHLSGQRDADGNLRITWTRRTRLGGGWQSYPLYEQEATFEVEIRRVATAELVSTYSVPLFSAVQPGEFLYTDDQQATDFGSAQSSVLVRLYQISATVGRGYMAEATL